MSASVTSAVSSAELSCWLSGPALVSASVTSAVCSAELSCWLASVSSAFPAREVAVVVVVRVVVVVVRVARVASALHSASLASSVRPPLKPSTLAVCWLLTPGVSGLLTSGVSWLTSVA